MQTADRLCASHPIPCDDASLLIVAFARSASSIVCLQVLITHDVWNMVRCNMAKAHYPVVQQIGLFKFDATSTPMWVYEVGAGIFRDPLASPLPFLSPAHFRRSFCR